MTPTTFPSPLEPVPPEIAAPVSLGTRMPFRVIAVTSGKGGVGKSNIVVNLGLALVNLGCRVLLIDADLGLANLNILLGLAPLYTIQDVFSLEQELSEVIVAGPPGLKILPASSGFPDLAELDEFQKLFLLNELDHYSEEFDLVLIDTGAGISRNVLFFNVAAQERILVANNQPTSLTDAYALMKIMAIQHRQTRFKLLVNGVRPREGEAVYRTLLQVADRFLEGEVSLEYLGIIPYDESVPQAVMRQQPVLTLYPEAPASRAFARIARQLRTTPPPEGVDGNIKLFWRRLLVYQS
jgi:flagellar biosynthesis protein FlhG